MNDMHPSYLLQFSPMKTTDVGEVDSISQSSFPTPWSPKTYIREIEEGPHSHYWVIRPNPSLGYGTAAVTLPSIFAYGGMWILDEEVHILVFATHPAWRECGIGEWLLLNMLILANQKGAKTTTLEVRESNVAAQSLYASMGFEEIGRRKNYYKDTNGSREDAIILSLPILELSYLTQRLNVKSPLVKERIQKRIRNSIQETFVFKATAP
ncbi:MAG: ribosomal protein S18-alanine N-acetyltransferase [Chloroflexota bacterium]